MEEELEEPERRRQPRVGRAMDDATATAWINSSLGSRSWRTGVAELLHKIRGALDLKIVGRRNPMELPEDLQRRLPIVIVQVQATAHQTLMPARSCR